MVSGIRVRVRVRVRVPNLTLTLTLNLTLTLTLTRVYSLDSRSILFCSDSSLGYTPSKGQG